MSEIKDGEKIELPVSLRDWFATKAMNSPDVMFASIFSFKWAAYIAYSYADAMIAEREKSK